jgi:Zn-dependent peptidase ImmA (M78 family)
MTHQRAHIKPELLVWARDQSRLTIQAAAAKLHVKPERLEAWERGQEEPTIRQLRNAAKVYHLTLAVFYLQSPPWLYQPIRDYRRLPSEAEAAISPELMLEIRRAYDRRDVVQELLATLDEEVPPFGLRASQSDDPEQLGLKIREYVHLTIEMQRGWRDPSIAFREARTLFERAGVLVFQTRGIPVEEMRGFSIGDSAIPVIVVNRADAPAGRQFTLFHEITHLALHSEGICDLSETGPRARDTRRLETLCNRVAGAGLVPRDLLLTIPSVRDHRGLSWDLPELQPLARVFQVSRQVILRRLLTLHRTNQATYDALMGRLDEEFKNLPKREPGFLSPPVNALSLVGRVYAGLALSAYYQQRITASTLSDVLGLRLRHVAELSRAMSG